MSFKEKQKSRIKEKENEAFLDYFEKCSHLDEKLMFNFGRLTRPEQNYPIEYEKYLDNLFYEIRISRQRLFLYLPVTHSLQKQSEKLFEKCADIRDVFNEKFGPVKVEIWNEMENLNNGTTQQIINRTSELDYYNSINPLRTSFRQELNSYILEMQKHFQI